MKRLAGLVLLAAALTGCGSTEASNELSAREETCGGNRSFMESVPECLHMSTAEKEKAEAYAHNQQVNSEAKDAESVLKKREAERTANAIEAG